jgi:putative hemolysin
MSLLSQGQITSDIFPATEDYRVRLADSEEAVRLAQELRYRIFNLELQEGLIESAECELDVDEFDPVCDHLLVEYIATGEVVGTYRMQTGISADENIGYYSAGEFDFSVYEPIRTELLELGRACIAKDHRTFSVIGLLWKAIAVYAKTRNVRYLIGCSSLTSQEPMAGSSLFYELSKKNLVEEKLRTLPHPDYECAAPSTSSECPKIPRLMAAYLALGAKISGPPAIDRRFGTIDFLTILDFKKLSKRAVLKYLS